MEFILTNSNLLSTHEKRVLSGLCINKMFGAWAWKENVLISMCKINDKIIGWSAINMEKNINNREENKIAVYVKKQYRGQGVGKKLVAMIMDKSANINVCCAPRKEHPEGFIIFNKYRNIKILDGFM